MTERELFRDQYVYNAWANTEVFSACARLDKAVLEARAPGTFGTLEETLKHLVGVEAVYLLMLQDQPLNQTGSQEEFFSRDLAWFAGRQARLGDDYDDLLSNAADDFLDAPLIVPWFDFPLRKRDGLLQVLSHSAWHRAQVFSTVGAQGVQVPDLDYVFFLRERQSTNDVPPA